MAIQSGSQAQADEVMNAFGSMFKDTAQLIFDVDYNGFNSKLKGDGTPDFNNVFYSTFQTDDATTKTNFTYDATNDLYSADTLSASATLEHDYTTLNNVDNCVLVVNGNVSKTYTDNITNNSFESAVGAEWTYSEVDTGGVISGVRSNADSQIGTWSYLISMSNLATASVNDYGQVAQTVDLTNVTHIGCWINSSNNNSNPTRLMIDSTIIATGVNNGGWTWVSGEIPSALRTSGKSVIVRAIKTNGGGTSTFNAYVDYLDLWNENESILTASIAADGTNFETVIPNQIHRFADLGTTPTVRLLLTPSGGNINGEVHKMTEQAVKYNFY